MLVEHKVVAYYVTGEDHYPVLENGEVVETVAPASDLPSSYISLKFSDRELVRQFVQEMKSISPSITDKIVSVDLTPSKVTKDLVTITMKMIIKSWSLFPKLPASFLIIRPLVSN